MLNRIGSVKKEFGAVEHKMESVTRSLSRPRDNSSKAKTVKF